MLKKDLVSVIIPTYNRANTITETVRSVLNQTYDKFEIIIIDDGSTDNTKDSVLKIDDLRIRYFWHEHTGLPAISRNIGLKMAGGEYIAFLDSDDIWLPQKLEKQVQFLKDYSDIFLVYSKCFIRSNGKIISVAPLNPKTGSIFNELYLRCNFVPILTVMMRNAEGRQPYSFDENKVLRAAEDYDLFLEIAYRERIAYIDEPLAIYSLHSRNISSDALANFKKAEYIMKKFGPFVPIPVRIIKYLTFYRQFFSRFILEEIKSIIRKKTLK